MVIILGLYIVSNLQLVISIELDDGKIYRKTLYLMVKSMVSCSFSLKPIQWYIYNITNGGIMGVPLAVRTYIQHFQQPSFLDEPPSIEKKMAA